ncbi:hypothetical protein [Nostoc sp.]
MKQSLEKRLIRETGRNTKTPDLTGDNSRRTEARCRQESWESSSRIGYI